MRGCRVPLTGANHQLRGEDLQSLPGMKIVLWVQELAEY